MNYKRIKHSGATYFFTVNLEDRSNPILTQHIPLLRQCFKSVQEKHPFYIDAIVILPDHLHCIWTLPKDDSDYSTRWMLIKSQFSRGIPQRETISKSRSGKRERGIWQRRFWEHVIRDDNDMKNHIEYIHNNPVKHGYAQRPTDWPYSSVHVHPYEPVLA